MFYFNIFKINRNRKKVIVLKYIDHEYICFIRSQMSPFLCYKLELKLNILLTSKEKQAQIGILVNTRE